jgi:PhnB protein
MAKKIDPLNKKQYGAVSTNLIVSDVKAAMNFYQKALGFTKRGVMNGPDGKPAHAELALRGTVIMLSPECVERGARSAKTLGGSPATLYLYTENADKATAKAVKLGATAQGPVADMFWGDRAGTIIDPEGYMWMLATHKSEPTPAEMKKAMAAQMQQQQPQSTATTA